MLVLRAFLLAVFAAVVSIIAELSFVFSMKLMGHPVRITSFGALLLFTTLMGFMPVWPSPSRISSTPISLVGRVLLVIEFTMLVTAAIFASSSFMAHEHVIVPVDIWFAGYAYVLILMVMLFANFGRLKREISVN
jgi:hypothetical protein